jgi:hypothetical protein
MDEAQPAAAYLLIQSSDDEAPTEAGQNTTVHVSPLSQPLASLGAHSCAHGVLWSPAQVHLHPKYCIGPIPEPGCLASLLKYASQNTQVAVHLSDWLFAAPQCGVGSVVLLRAVKRTVSRTLD